MTLYPTRCEALVTAGAMFVAVMIDVSCPWWLDGGIGFLGFWTILRMFVKVRQAELDVGVVSLTGQEQRMADQLVGMELAILLLLGIIVPGVLMAGLVLMIGFSLILDNSRRC